MKAAMLTAVVFLLAGPLMGVMKQDNVNLYTDVHKYIMIAASEFENIPESRREMLRKLSGYVRSRNREDKPVNLTFICTHNSRRSHMSQIWAQTAAAFYGIPNVTAYSGGTASTAFNPRAVAAIRRAGFRVDKTTEGENPIYHIRYSNERPAITGFSKVYDSAPNPSKEFCAVMTCSSADKACPIVRGASLRIAIPFVDPKAFDNTDQEAAKYDERCRQICRDMLYVFSQARAQTADAEHSTRPRQRE